ncbi:PTS system, N-acetylgalactosamine-specific IIA component [Thermoanaerobacter uzonensis DSM 18761]|jgi:PTS system N-acetylgalactosamine-specific IIA component|uniref:PTS system, N-acetylgalactosamine-specific IIA component n=1 Tax=Thermoanaerobacter uzonensis DSM 18761 TaxID=1123369 RepID=A0A1M4SDU8_9THEO|nr:PTS sugar transporter subunit IIA [Thermoanaerobacter uzonensis]SHE30332.1 PTS system, N-acetylgalactosamine-specific IIA component [Thermoanaerobacter uzonensis DSM 18761]
MHDTVIIITGHGNYATGLKSSIQLIAGIIDGAYAIDFKENDSDMSLKYKIKEILDKYPNSPVLIICDIVGGTPFKVASEFAVSGDKKIELVAGCNLSALLEIVLQKDKLSISELANLAVKTTKNSVLNFTQYNEHHKDDEGTEKMKEGI